MLNCFLLIQSLGREHACIFKIEIDIYLHILYMWKEGGLLTTNLPEDRYILYMWREGGLLATNLSEDRYILYWWMEGRLLTTYIPETRYIPY